MGVRLSVLPRAKSNTRTILYLIWAKGQPCKLQSLSLGVIREIHSYFPYKPPILVTCFNDQLLCFEVALAPQVPRILLDIKAERLKGLAEEDEVVFVIGEYLVDDKKTGFALSQAAFQSLQERIGLGPMDFDRCLPR
jgi:alkyl hydroperoxide reductase subunit AhpF